MPVVFVYFVFTCWILETITDIHTITAIPTQVELSYTACTIDFYQKPAMKEIDIKYLSQNHNNTKSMLALNSTFPYNESREGASFEETEQRILLRFFITVIENQTICGSGD